ncbi:MAG: ribonuclease H-like domain-containing protein [Candidatus Kapaibacteriales bacterium]
MIEKFLTFDIETVPLDWNSFSPSQQEFILRNLSSEEEIEKRKAELGLSPFTAQIICIGLLYVEVEDGTEFNHVQVAYSVAKSQEEIENFGKVIQISNSTQMYLDTETGILDKFWKLLQKHQDIHLISFNGRNFDSPFLMLRSALLGIRPSRNLMEGTKFNYRKHTDLIDELTFYQPTYYFSATKRFNLDFYTRAFGIESPKSHGIDGTLVPQLFKEGHYSEIAEYCIGDVIATWELFKIWKKTLEF